MMLSIFLLIASPMEKVIVPSILIDQLCLLPCVMYIMLLLAHIL